ncbi:hypothetical protein TIFTF001_001465 [Ficus carica]|uniref:Uncharacterized protein n=1 Tax=Ficus carica TaxID=3494 RepID=A0AA88D4P2_FICCA|nr:hypothetical protein TIFTF001_001465 [Ficus carica]
MKKRMGFALRSKVDLDQHLIRPGDKFLGFMWKTRESYIRLGLRVEKLTISMAPADNLDPQTLSSSIKDWINFVFATDNNLKELKISSYNLKKSYFPLNLRPSNTLTTYYPQNSSPFLKSLSLIACAGLENLEISGLVNITSVSIRSCRSLKRFVSLELLELNLSVFHSQERLIFTILTKLEHLHQMTWYAHNE